MAGSTRQAKRMGPLARRGLPLRGAVVVFATLLPLLGGCTGVSEYFHNGFKVGPNYKKPAAPVAPEWVEAHRPEICTARADLREWWTVFNDPVLNQLVELAYRQNLNLRIAGTRVLEARALRASSVVGLLPQMQDAFASYQREAVSRTTAQTQFITPFQTSGIPGLPVRPFPAFYDQWSAGFNLSWELDFWGKFRRLIESANAELDASVENYDDALVTLIGDVATYYIQVRTYQERIKYAEENIAEQEKLTEAAKSQFQTGGKSKLGYAQMNSNLTDTRALKEQLDEGLRLANDRLCILLGIPVRDLTAEIGKASVPAPPPQAIVGVPADLLRRRPDVRAAERQVASASAQIGVAESEWYPHLSIIGTLGWQSQSLSQLFGPQSLNGNVGPSLQWNILNYGKILNNVRVADARWQRAVYNYQQTVLNAGREAEDGMITFIKAQLRTRQLSESAASAEEAVGLVQLLKKEKEYDVNQAFVASNFKTQQQDKLAQARGDVALGLIQVYRALGGGWQIRLKDCSPQVAPAPQELPGVAVAAPAPAPVDATPPGNSGSMQSATASAPAAVLDVPQPYSAPQP